jgi:hypothetical protein
MHPESFLGGLAKFNDYLAQLAEPYDFNGNELRRIMDTFQDPFVAHFHNEIATIASFADLPSAPKPSSQKAVEAAAIFRAWGKKTVAKAGYTDVVPFFLLNLDTTYENGMWASWPPMPAPIKWGLRAAIRQVSHGRYMHCNFLKTGKQAKKKIRSCNATIYSSYYSSTPRRPQMGTRCVADLRQQQVFTC